MARTKRTAGEKVKRYQRKLAQKRKSDEEWAEHVHLEITGELSAMTISWKGRMEELMGLLAGNSWEVVEDLRDESRQAIVCPICTLEMMARGRQAPSIVPCHLFKVHLQRIHQIVEDLYLARICNKVPGSVSKAVENHYEQGGCSELVGGEAAKGQRQEAGREETNREPMWKKSELVRSVSDLKVWEVEKMMPGGQILVACPVCKLEKRKDVRVNRSMVKSNQFKIHFEQEHKPQKFLLKSRCLKCPICQELVPSGLLGVHFDQRRTCEKAVALEKVKIHIKEEESEVKMEIGGAGGPEAGTSTGEYMELCNPDVKIKLEYEETVKTEAVEEMQEVVPQISKEEILKEATAASHHKYREVFHVKEMDEEYIQKLVQKYLVESNQPVTLLKRLTKDLWYKYKHEPGAGEKRAWKCWITSSDGINICASYWNKKGAMYKVAIRALAQLFSISVFPRPKTECIKFM